MKNKYKIIIILILIMILTSCVNKSDNKITYITEMKSVKMFEHISKSNIKIILYHKNKVVSRMKVIKTVYLNEKDLAEFKEFNDFTS